MNNTASEELIQREKLVTLIFIKSCDIRYLGPSNDPIFPADLEIGRFTWIDSSDQPHILGCQESSMICDTAECYSIEQIRCGRRSTSGLEIFNAGFNRSVSDLAVLNLLALSLANSYIGQRDLTVNKLLAERSEIIESKSELLSFALDDKHWQTEIRRLFEVSLARLQGTVVDFARGKNSDRDNHVQSKQEAWKEACSLIKIQTKGWKNINVVEFVCFSSFLLLLWISTIKYRDQILLVWMYRLVIEPLSNRSHNAINHGINKLITTTTRTLQATFWQKLQRFDFRKPNAQ